MTKVNESVERGFGWLSQEMPHFLGRVNLDELLMSDIRYCMVGQTLGPGAFGEGRAGARQF